MVKRSLARVVVCLGALLLGCGGHNGILGEVGGSGGGAGGAGGAPDPTQIAPNVIETFPQDMTTDVEPSTMVSAQFDTALDEATLTTTSFRVRRADDARLPGNVTVDMTGLTAVFTLDDLLDLGCPFTATLTTDIESVSGGALGANFSWTFTTRDGAWVGAEPVETGDTDATSPQVVLDVRGNAIAVWSQLEMVTMRIWASRFMPTLGWGAATIISDDGAAGVAQVAIDPLGNAVAVWDESDGMSRNVWANRFTPTAGWSGGELIEDSTGNTEAAQVGLDERGNATAVWAQQTGGRVDTWANRFTPEAWNDAARIEVNNAGDVSSPRLAVASTGSAAAVWSQSDGTRTNIWTNRFAPGMGWEVNAELIDLAAGDAISPDVALDPNGDAIAVWSQTDGVRFNIWANRFTRTNDWGSAQLIETNDAGSANGARIALDPSGNGLAVWHQSDGTRTNIWASRFTQASGWDEPELIEDSDLGDASSPQVAVDSKGRAIAVWSQSDGLRLNIWANRFTPSAGWGAPELLELGDAGDAVSPQITLNPSGRAIATWSYNDGARSGIWANRFE